MYYDYGNNVTYQDNNVYVNGTTWAQANSITIKPPTSHRRVLQPRRRPTATGCRWACLP